MAAYDLDQLRGEARVVGQPRGDDRQGSHPTQPALLGSVGDCGHGHAQGRETGRLEQLGYRLQARHASHRGGVRVHRVLGTGTTALTADPIVCTERLPATRAADCRHL